MLTLNTTQIRGKNITVRANFRIESKELSGQTSSSDRSEEGIKPCTLSVSVQISFAESQNLTRLREMATALDTAGNLKVYDIVNETAAAMKVRQVTFTDNFSVAQAGSLNAWQVSFTLAEYRSSPEKIEQRQPQKIAQMQTPEAGEVVSEIPPPTNQEEQLSMAKRILKHIDQALA